MSAKNWLKNLIFEEGTVKNQPAEKTQDQPSKTSASAGLGAVSAEPSIHAGQIVGKVDKTLLSKLCAVLDEQSLGGIDYLKFKKSVDSLKDFQPEENIRFTTAYVTLKATDSSLSKERLVQTINEYVDLMEKERQTGLAQLKALRAKNIDTKEKEIVDAVKKVEKMKTEIQELTRYISETETEIAAKKNEIIIRETDFNTTVDQIVNQLKSDKIKIETIIKS